jgi:5-methylcytosine-specific restriction endonuclease McrA
MPMSTPEAQREYQRLWIAKRRADFFADKYCVSCSSIERLELDHIDPSTKEHHAIWSWSKARRDIEIAKCQILCHDCHLKKTSAENSTATHGSRTYYMEHKCRCDKCIVAASEYRQNQRKGLYKPTMPS